ncbi:hypothetical protein [Sandarakinorhabdus oryzae]|uniref:hypothetical protein n=1 Tax=Sandarakinorhabdus oryzae TaxID=2675220 RepID=UPI0012E231BD|nr:hypothetical protein [Sandarakinorhabdus oryzae]
MRKRAGPSIVVRNADRDEAQLLFIAAGFTPVAEVVDEGDMTRFFFDRLADEQLHRLANAIPPSMYAKRAIVGGYPFEDLNQ